MTFGEKLLKLRTSHDLTHKEMERLTGISATNFSKYESGKIKPTSDKIMILCRFFQVSADWFLFGDDDPSEVHFDLKQKKTPVINDPDLQYAYEILKELYQSPNPNLRGWAIITFENAFADYIEEPLQQVQKRKKDA
jgi:Predicted transcriptional regulators